MESTLARFGPTTPKRATTSLAASVDPTEARKDAGQAVCVRRTTFPLSHPPGGRHHVQDAAIGDGRRRPGKPHLLLVLPHDGEKVGRQQKVLPAVLGPSWRVVARPGSSSSRELHRPINPYFPHFSEASSSNSRNGSTSYLANPDPGRPRSASPVRPPTGCPPRATCRPCRSGRCAGSP